MATQNCTTLLFALALLAMPCSADIIGFSVSMPQTVQPTGKHAEWTRAIQRFDPDLGTLNSLTFDLSISAYLQFDVISRPSEGTLSTVVPNSRAEFMGVVQTNNRTGNALGYTMPCGVPPSQFVPNPLPTCPSVISFFAIELGYFHGVLTDQSATVTNTKPGRLETPTWLSPPSLLDFVGDSPMTLAMQLDPVPYGGGNDVYGDLRPLLLAGFFYPATTGHFSISYNYTPTPFVEAPVASPEPRYVGMMLGVILLGGLTLKRRSLHI